MKARIKSNGVFDVLSMSLFTVTEQLPDWYYVCLINSEFISMYVDNFINNTSHFQINDARQLPIVVPNDEQLRIFKEISETSISIKKSFFSYTLSNDIEEEILNKMQKELDRAVLKLYSIE